MSLVVQFTRPVLGIGSDGKLHLGAEGPNGKAFRSYAELLQHICRNVSQAGWHRTPESFFLGSRFQSGNGPLTPGDLYWANESIRSADLKLTGEQMARLFYLQDRYKSLCRYLREVEPEWKTESETHWADNSIDMHQVDKRGNKRTVQKVAPHGDIC